MKRHYNSFLILLYIIFILGIIGIFYKIEVLFSIIGNNHKITPSQFASFKQWIWFLLILVGGIGAVFLIFEIIKASTSQEESSQVKELPEEVPFSFEDKLSSIKDSLMLLQKELDSLVKWEKESSSYFGPGEIEKFENCIKELKEIKVKEKYYNLKEEPKEIDRIGELMEKLPDFALEFESNLMEDSKTTGLMQEKIKEINKVIEVIRKIATETRLIAFNAAIESSRSKEEGRGFNVVVSQIRNLVDEIEEATSDIQDTMKELEVLSSKSVLMSEILSKKIIEKKRLTLEIREHLEPFLSFPSILEELTENITLYSEKCKKTKKELESLLKAVKKEQKRIEEIVRKRDKAIENIYIILKDIEDNILGKNE